MIVSMLMNINTKNNTEDFIFTHAFSTIKLPTFPTPCELLEARTGQTLMLTDTIRSYQWVCDNDGNFWDLRSEQIIPTKELLEFAEKQAEVALGQLAVIIKTISDIEASRYSLPSPKLVSTSAVLMNEQTLSLIRGVFNYARANQHIYGWASFLAHWSLEKTAGVIAGIENNQNLAIITVWKQIVYEWGHRLSNDSNGP